MSGIECPKCGRVMNRVARTEPRIGYVWRRRDCECGNRETTTERIVGTQSGISDGISSGSSHKEAKGAC